MYKQLLDYIPTIVFVLAYVASDIITATAAMIGSGMICVAIYYTVYQSYSKMMLASTGTLIVLGGLTLVLQDERFIKMKPTAVNSALALACFISAWLKKPLMRYIFGSKIQAPDSVFNTLTLRFGAFFIVMAVLNELVWRNFSTDFWVTYKLFGGVALMILFLLSQIRLLLPYIKENS